MGKVIDVKLLRSGQVRRYGDIEYAYEVRVDEMTMEDVEKYCKENVRKCDYKVGEGRPWYEGYYKIDFIGDGKYAYTVREPYLD